MQGRGESKRDGRAEVEVAAGVTDPNPHFTRSNRMGWRVPRWIGNGFAASGRLRQRMSPHPVRVMITGLSRAFGAPGLAVGVNSSLLALFSGPRDHVKSHLTILLSRRRRRREGGAPPFCCLNALKLRGAGSRRGERKSWIRISMTTLV
jgi:hypothetical protein